MTQKHHNGAMDNPINWSLKIGRLFAIDIRLHLFFILWCAIRVIRDISDYHKAWGISIAGAVAWGLGTILLLFVIVLLHEFGHCFGARWMGGDADHILIWPLGGLAYVDPPNKPVAHLVTTAAGPMVNVLICLVTGVALWIWLGTLGALPLNPFHPFTPIGLPGFLSTGPYILAMAFGLSYILLLFNLLPVFPLDGGRLLRAWLWRHREYADATRIAAGVGMIGAIVFALVALLAPGENVLLLCIAGFGYLTCYQERRLAREQAYADDSPFGYDFSRGFAAFDEDSKPRKRPGFFARRRAARLVRRRARELERHLEREQKFDRILEKISEHGIDALTPGERKFLEDETQRRQKS